MRYIVFPAGWLALAAPFAGALAAQEPIPSPGPCYDVTEGEWVLDEETRDYAREPIPYEYDADSVYFQIPPRIQVVGQQVVVPPNALPVPRFRGSVINGGELQLGVSNGYVGVGVTLHRSGDGWTGVARTFSDVMPHQVYERPIELTRVPCDSPPPVSINAMRPLARTVELEGGEVIRLGKPLPESLSTRTRPSGDWTVIGRTTGLFGTTDSIAVWLHPTTRVVWEIRLTYQGDDAYSVMEARLRDVFGIQDYEGSYRNRITLLSLVRSGRTRILLEDRLVEPWP